jgi:hypothetical protein
MKQTLVVVMNLVMFSRTERVRRRTWQRVEMKKRRPINKGPMPISWNASACRLKQKREDKMPAVTVKMKRIYSVKIKMSRVLKVRNIISEGERLVNG